MAKKSKAKQSKGVSPSGVNKQKEWDIVTAFKAYLVFGPAENRKVFDEFYESLRKELNASKATLTPSPEEAMELLVHHVFIFTEVRKLFCEEVIKNNRLTRLIDKTVDRLKLIKKGG